ncbi:hypothetical protein BX600DRAFT_15461 [Xylariales sp. PMI_506]|nr:hypothetical protein BX600DRAFT_15461 [Xylariales sp. PMI_506]
MVRVQLGEMRSKYSLPRRISPRRAFSHPCPVGATFNQLASSMLPVRCPFWSRCKHLNAQSSDEGTYPVPSVTNMSPVGRSVVLFILPFPAHKRQPFRYSLIDGNIKLPLSPPLDHCGPLLSCCVSLRRVLGPPCPSACRTSRVSQAFSPHKPSCK